MRRLDRSPLVQVVSSHGGGTVRLVAEPTADAARAALAGGQVNAAVIAGPKGEACTMTTRALTAAGPMRDRSPRAGRSLLWLHADSAAGDGPRPKDLYDAVILAEDTRTQHRAFTSDACGLVGLRRRQPRDGRFRARLAEPPDLRARADESHTLAPCPAITGLTAASCPRPPRQQAPGCSSLERTSGQELWRIPCWSEMWSFCSCQGHSPVLRDQARYL